MEKILLVPVTEVFGERREVGRAATALIHVETQAQRIVSKDVTHRSQRCAPLWKEEQARSSLNVITTKRTDR